MTAVKKLTGIALAAAAAGMFMTAGLGTAVAGEGKVHCEGVNSCKGHSDCKTAKSACKGQNACKGQGFVALDEKACKQIKG
ncbi:MAG: BufA2 family periplasmic bufferin-type metallophore [Burkholderiales bacterium]